jgi:hypothetical protein
VAWPQVRRRREDTAHPGRLTPSREAVATARAEPGDPDDSLDPVRLTYPREQSRLVRADQDDAHQPADLAVEVRRWSRPNGPHQEAPTTCPLPAAVCGLRSLIQEVTELPCRLLAASPTSRAGSRRRPHHFPGGPEASAERTWAAMRSRSSGRRGSAPSHSQTPCWSSGVSGRRRNATRRPSVSAEVAVTAARAARGAPSSAPRSPAAGARRGRPAATQAPARAPVAAPGRPPGPWTPSTTAPRRWQPRSAPAPLWVSDIWFTSCGLRILMDQPAEPTSSQDPRRRRQDNRHAGPGWRCLPRARGGRCRSSWLAHSASTDRSCRQPKLSMRSSTSRPTVPTHRAADASARGARTGVMGTLTASAAKTASNAAVNFVSRSRTRTGTSRRGRQGRWAGCGPAAPPMHPLAAPVTRARGPGGEATSITNSRYRRLRHTVSTVKQSTASTPVAWARRNCRQETADRRSDSLWPAAAPDPRSPAPRLDGHAGVGGSNGAGPGRGAIAAAWPVARTGHARQGGAAAAPAQPAPRGRPSPTGVGPPAGAAPRPGAATPAAPRGWSPSAVPAAPATPTAGRRSDTAVVAPSVDHRRQRLPRRTRSSEPTADSLAPTGCCWAGPALAGGRSGVGAR